MARRFLLLDLCFPFFPLAVCFITEKTLMGSTSLGSELCLRQLFVFFPNVDFDLVPLNATINLR